MKTYRTIVSIRGLATLVGGFAWFTGALQAAPFVYTPGDLVLAFRQTGNASDYVVNIGKAADYSSLPAGASLTVTNLSVDQLNAAFTSLNGLAWSVAAANRPPQVAAYPLQTLWVTAPRQVVESQSAPWIRKGQFVQGNAASQIDAIGNNAAASSSSQVAGPNNTVTGVVIPSNTDFALAKVLGDSGNYAGTFQGSAENTTAGDFDSAVSNLSRSDLYELVPGTSASGTLNTDGKYLGTFELKPDGSLTFTKPSLEIPRPTLSVTRVGELTRISFGTVGGVTYRLRFTDAAGLSSPVSSWTAGATVVGDGSTKTLEDSQSEAPSRFYAIEVQQ